MDTSRPRKVLVIDDEPDVVELLREVLGAHKYEAIATTKWTDAVDALAHEHPDLMLMDLNMPTIDGPRLLKFVREEGYGLPVMVVSGFISDEMRQMLDPLHVWAYVEKPFEIHDLANEIARVLQESEAAGSPTVGEATEIVQRLEIQRAEEEAPSVDSDPSPEVPVDTGPGVLAPRRTHRPHRERKPMPSNEPSFLSLFFRKRVAHLLLIAIVCMALAGMVVIMAERSNEESGQYVNPHAQEQR